MRRTASFARLPILAGLLFALLTSCNFAPFGHSARYAEHVRPGIEVTMPADARSTSQQFFRLDAQGRPGHIGLDVSAPVGTPVLAAAGGEVVTSHYEPFYGNRISIRHGTGPEGALLRTVYLHMKERHVQVGDRVTRGQQIGTLGATGALAALPHLHFELHRMEGRKDTPIDPHLGWVDGPGKVSCFRPGKRYARRPVRMTYPVVCGL